MHAQRCPEKDRGEGPYTQLLRLSLCLSFLSRNTIFSASPGTQFLPSCSMACFSPKGPLWLTTPCSSLLNVHLGGDGDVYNNLSANSEVLSKMRTWHSVPPRRSVPEAEARTINRQLGQCGFGYNHSKKTGARSHSRWPLHLRGFLSNLL